MYLQFPDIGKPIQFCLEIILKEAREEHRLVKQIFYTMASAYTNNPSNLAINSPSGEGKSYVLTKVGEVFPKEDVMFLSGMTDKALFHRPGILVIKNDQNGEYEAIDDRIAKIDSDIEDKQNEMDNAKAKNLKQGLISIIKALEKEKKDLLKETKKLIDLSHKILVFLDTPKPDLFSALMPLLSHDKYEVEYEFVDTHNSIKTKTNLLRGWPAVIFAQAIDYSHHRRYPEIQRRFIITNPKMSVQKYERAIDLIGEKFGLPDFAYQQKIVSDSEKEMVREIIRGIKDKIFDVCHAVEPGKNNVIIPFYEVITNSMLLPKEKASDMTTANRLFGFLTLLPVINVDNRPKIVLRRGGDPIIQTIPFALFEDMSEALSLMEYSDGVRPYVLEWYYNVFLEAFDSKKEPDSKVSSRGETITERRIALTTEQLVDATFEKQKKKYSSKQLLESFVNPLINQGYIDKAESELDKRANIYYPVLVNTKNRKLFENGQSNNFLQQNKLGIKNSTLYPTKQYLISKIQAVLRYSAEHGDFSFVKIKDHEGHEITVEELVDRYYKDPDRYFEFNGNNDNNGNNMPPPPSLPLPTLLPSLPLLLDIQSNEREDDGSPSSPPPNLPYETAEQNYHYSSSKEEASDEYVKNSKITSESQQISNESIESIQLEDITSNKLFETPKSNNFLYSPDQGQNLSNVLEQQHTALDKFKCFYCDHSFANDIERAAHIDYEHPGRLHYPLPNDFDYRLER
jgi:hypothetical protein